MRWFASVACLAFLSVSLSGACKSSPTAAPDPVVPCDGANGPVAMQSFALDDVAVHVDTTDAMLDPVRVDLAADLGAMWGGAISVSSSAPDFGKPATIWISTSDAAKAKLGALAASDQGYALGRVDEGGRAIVIAWAKDAPTLAHATYALLEELGARFFHPMQELLPRFASARIPASLSIARKPAMRSRGLQMHVLHPIEYAQTLHVPSPASLAEAKRLVDWLVKTGQNFFQWTLMETVDFDAWRPHAQAIVDYAHSRGVKVGAVVQVWGGAALQNNYVLVKDQAQWQAQMDSQLDRLMTVNWDTVALALGEFVSIDPQTIIDWLSHAVDHVVTKSPSTEVDVQNHVGNFKQLYVQYQGQTVFYYHLPRFADARLGQSVHTLFFFDVYRDWAMYDHPDFHLQHDYMLEMLPSRRVSYFPESAYWISADVDVPAFLPAFVQARWNDIHGLTKEIAQKGLPPLEGHLMFTSGHEWGYWMTDYLAAKMLWEPEQPLDHFVAHYAGAYGSCANDIGGALSSFIDLQSKYLFDRKLVPYISGEDTTVDFGYLAGIPTHPRRVQFEEVTGMGEGDRATFEANVVVGLEEFARAIAPLEDGVAARCRGSDETRRPWCDELWDGMKIVRLRALHAAHLYRAALALGAKRGDARGELDHAIAATDDAARVIAHRESQYRFDVERLTGSYPNATHYYFGYLRQAHTQCFWHRREAQVRTLIEDGAPASLLALPGCSN